MSGCYAVLACAPSGDVIRCLLAFRLSGTHEFLSAARRQSERLQRKVMTVMNKLRHVTPLPVTAGSVGAGSTAGTCGRWRP